MRSRLEIHRDLLPGHGFRLATDAVWARARRVPANDRVVLVPHPVHQLLHVCVHFAWSHGMQWGTWRALRDVAAITHRDDFAWSELDRKSTRLNSSHTVISYAVFCLKKKKEQRQHTLPIKVKAITHQ